jgi:hypothetical protein
MLQTQERNSTPKQWKEPAKDAISLTYSSFSIQSHGANGAQTVRCTPNEHCKSASARRNLMDGEHRRPLTGICPGPAEESISDYESLTFYKPHESCNFRVIIT